MKKVAIVLSCYDKDDDLLAHLDILRFCHWKYRVIVSYLHPDDPPVLPNDIDLIRLKSLGFTSGPLLSLTNGVRRAAELGADWVVFRNADDWLFNHSLTRKWIEHMEANDCVAAGYNWLSVGTFNDFTLNENILSVQHFMRTVQDAERYFLSSDQTFHCEYKMAWWVRKTISNLDSQFFRLPGREQEPGIGREIETMPDFYKTRNKKMPLDLYEKLRDNQRFFNRDWQLIGSHDNLSRLRYYNEIKDSIPYVFKLEKQPNFWRWLVAAHSGLEWNKKGINHSRLFLKTRPKPIRTNKQLPRKLFFTKVFS